MSIQSIVILLVVVLAICQGFETFTLNKKMVIKSSKINRLKMEYIPDGLTKKQWEEMKRKEAELLKGKDFGKIGITKFQSRSFEAWQKSGQKNLFPVDPKAPLESKPYMQRPGGTPDGADLKQKGLKGTGFGKEVAKNDVDLKYEGQSQTGFNLPWTSDSLGMFSKKKESTGGSSTSASTDTTKKSTAPTKSIGKTTPSKPDEPPKKLFGLF